MTRESCMVGKYITRQKSGRVKSIGHVDGCHTRYSIHTKSVNFNYKTTTLVCVYPDVFDIFCKPIV